MYTLPTSPPYSEASHWPLQDLASGLGLSRGQTFVTQSLCPHGGAPPRVSGDSASSQARLTSSAARWTPVSSVMLASVFCL